jgi:hypothetical protein
MNKQQKRMFLFLAGCIPARMGVVYLARTATTQTLPLMGFLALFPAVGFLYFFLTGTRTTGPEVLGDRIWWNALRPLHAAFWAAFAVLALFGYNKAWILLLIDVLVGISAFTLHHVGFQALQ